MKAFFFFASLFSFSLISCGQQYPTTVIKSYQIGGAPGAGYQLKSDANGHGVWSSFSYGNLQNVTDTDSTTTHIIKANGFWLNSGFFKADPTNGFFFYHALPSQPFCRINMRSGFGISWEYGNNFLQMGSDGTNISGPIRFQSLSGPGNLVVDNQGNLSVGSSSGGGGATPTLDAVLTAGNISSKNLSVGDVGASNVVASTGTGTFKYLKLFNPSSGGYGILDASGLSAGAQTWSMPNKSGTVALTSDIPYVPETNSSSVTVTGNLGSGASYAARGNSTAGYIEATLGLNSLPITTGDGWIKIHVAFGTAYSVAPYSVQITYGNSNGGTTTSANANAYTAQQNTWVENVSTTGFDIRVLVDNNDSTWRSVKNGSMMAFYYRVN